MAIYLYYCPCGYEQEISHSIHFDGGYQCPDCLSVLVRKPQPTGVTFNGPGFYRTDR